MLIGVARAASDDNGPCALRCPRAREMTECCFELSPARGFLRALPVYLIADSLGLFTERVYYALVVSLSQILEPS